jgi:hypothetical protein
MAENHMRGPQGAADPGEPMPPPVPNTSAAWYCTVGGQQFGPVEAAELANWFAQGRIAGNTPVWRQGMPGWAPLAHQPDLLAELRSRGVDLRPRGLGDDAGVRLLLPVGRSPMAIAAGYLGLLSIVPAVGLLAVGFAVWAIHDIRRNPRRHGMGRAVFGFIAGALGTLLWAWVLTVRFFLDR